MNTFSFVTIFLVCPKPLKGKIGWDLLGPPGRPGGSAGGRTAQPLATSSPSIPSRRQGGEEGPEGRTYFSLSSPGPSSSSCADADVFARWQSKSAMSSDNTWLAAHARAEMQIEALLRGLPSTEC